MKTIFKITERTGVRSDNNLFKKEWYCSTNKLAEAFKAEKEKALPATDGNISGGCKGYTITPIQVMDSEDDFYKKELR